MLSGTPTTASLRHDPPGATPANASFAAGDLLEAPADAICNPVNLAGVMGRGLALQFRTRWPPSYRAYRAALRTGELGRGRIHAHRLPDGRHVLPPGRQRFGRASTARTWRTSATCPDTPCFR